MTRRVGMAPRDNGDGPARPTRDVAWLTITRGAAPLLVSIPHAGSEIPPEFQHRLVALPLARLDGDWWVDRLYECAGDLGATLVRTAISRTIIDVNRDPAGRSLYPGQTTTELCPIRTFDGQPLYRDGAEPDDHDIADRRARFFAPYHAGLAAEIARLKATHRRVVLYDAHAIRSVIPRLFDGVLPHFNIGTNGGDSCARALTGVVEAACATTPFSRVTDGRFKGGWITRHYGRPSEGIHAIQMELACRGYMTEPPGPATPENWPVAYDQNQAAPMCAALRRILEGCLAFASARN
jgi:N-formylglutamate deformylase